MQILCGPGPLSPDRFRAMYHVFANCCWPRALLCSPGRAPTGKGQPGPGAEVLLSLDEAFHIAVNQAAALGFSV